MVNTRLIDLLDEQTLVQLMAMLFLLVMLGLVMVLAAWWGSRALRRQFRRADDLLQRRQPYAASDDDWAEKPLVRAEFEDPPAQPFGKDE